MGNITRVYWRLYEKETDTYFQGAATYENALEVVKVLQGASAADVVGVSFGVGAVVPSLTGERRRRFVYDVDPAVQAVDLSAFRRPGDGAGLWKYLAVRLRSQGRSFSLTVPSPRVTLTADSQAKDLFLSDLVRTFENASKQRVDVVRSWCTTPNIQRKILDETA